jgi:hypothetical protein
MGTSGHFTLPLNKARRPSTWSCEFSRPSHSRSGPPGGRDRISFSPGENFRATGDVSGKQRRARAAFCGVQIARSVGKEAIYQRPRDYDLEHEGDEEDVAFYVKLLEKWAAPAVNGAGVGQRARHHPLARAAAASGVEIVGLEREGSMLEEAYRKRAALSDTERAGVFGDYTMRPLRGTSRQLIASGARWLADRPLVMPAAPVSYN